MKNEEILKDFVNGTESEAFQTKEENAISLGNQIGWVRLVISDLPSKGLFYPNDTVIAIKAATAAEIRHWSTLVESDLNMLDEMLNYILERCVTVQMPGQRSTWKDITEIDRFYIILAVRELTFKSENPIQVKIGENGTRSLSKEMISFIKLDESIMKFYSDANKCFELKFKNGTTHYIGLPTVGVVNWIKKYVIEKQRAGLKFDEDFVGYAPFFINEWKGLDVKSYENLVGESHTWSIQEVSVFAKFKDKIVNAVTPDIVYKDESGMEVHCPLNFRDGLKSIFIIPDAFDELL